MSMPHSVGQHSTCGADAWHRFVAAWPSLSILAFLALGYLPLFRRVDDTALLIAGLVWGLLLASGFNIRHALGFEIAYGLLGATTPLSLPYCASLPTTGSVWRCS